MSAGSQCRGPLQQPGSFADDSDDDPTCGDEDDAETPGGDCSDEALACAEMDTFRAVVSEALSEGRREITVSV